MEYGGGKMNEELDQLPRLAMLQSTEVQTVIALCILSIIINDVLKEEDSLHVQLLNKIGGC